MQQRTSADDIFDAFFLGALRVNIPTTTKVIWRWGHCLAFHSTDWRSWGLNSGPLSTRGVIYPLHYGGSYFCVCMCVIFVLDKILILI